MNPATILAIAMGGALGATARHLIGVWFVGGMQLASFWATFTVNAAGSTMAGLLLGTMIAVWSSSETLRAFLFVGCLGGFTTFSAFSVDVVLMAERGQYLAATAYAVGSVAASVAGLFAGMRAMRALLT